LGTLRVADIRITPLKRIQVDGGDVLHAMKSSDNGFEGFGEAYFSLITSGAVKGWKRHLEMTLNLVVPFGDVKFIFIDDYGDRREEIIGADRYSRITVPPNIWFGFAGLSEPYSLVANIANIEHNPNEIERSALDAFKVNWG